MTRLVLLLEERSMKVLLDALLPRAFPGLDFLCVSHEGKSDLESSVRRKLRAWREPGVRFIVVRDNDGADCRALKQALMSLVPPERKNDTLVRIACQELEAWYFGDPDAMAMAFADDSLRAIRKQARFREPDGIQQPSTALMQLAPAFQKIAGARAMGSLLDPARNDSPSFRVFLDGIGRLSGR